MLTQEELKRIWHYDPNTGLFTRLVATSRRVNVGDIANCHNKAEYIIIQIDGKSYRAHRLAWLYVHGDWPKGVIDHWDTIRDHNWIDNLRDVTQSVNCQNQRKPPCTNTSSYAGVSWHKGTCKWLAQITVNNKNIYLGLFDDVHEAGAHYLQKKRELHPGCTI